MSKDVNSVIRTYILSSISLFFLNLRYFSRTYRDSLTIVIKCKTIVDYKSLGFRIWCSIYSKIQVSPLLFLYLRFTK